MQSLGHDVEVDPDALSSFQRFAGDDATRLSAIHRAAAIEVYAVDPGLVDAFELKLERNLSFELTRTDAHLYVSLGTDTLSGEIARSSLVEA